MNEYLLAAVLFSTVNVILILGLVYLYSMILIKTRAAYPAGLLIFALLLLAQNVVTVFGYTAMGNSLGGRLDVVVVAVTMFECGGLLALLKVTI